MPSVTVDLERWLRIEPGWPVVQPGHRWLGGDVMALAKVLGTGP